MSMRCLSFAPDIRGYWCGGCTVNMSQTVELNRKFAGRPLAIVAIHDQSVQSRAAYDAKISMVRQRLWGGSDLPFCVSYLPRRMDRETEVSRLAPTQ
jgi:hypothetical protein